MDFKVTKATLEIVMNEACQEDQNIFARGTALPLRTFFCFRKILSTCVYITTIHTCVHWVGRKNKIHVDLHTQLMLRMLRMLR